MARETDALAGAVVASLRDLITAVLEEAGVPTKPEGKAEKLGSKAKGKGKPAEDDEITFDSLKKKLMRVVNEKDEDAAKALLKKFKVVKLGNLDESKFEKFNAALDEALGSEDEDGDGEDMFGE